MTEVTFIRCRCGKLTNFGLTCSRCAEEGFSGNVTEGGYEEPEDIREPEEPDEEDP